MYLAAIVSLCIITIVLTMAIRQNLPLCISQAMYLAAIVTLCILTIILTMAERFATPSFRPLRAGLFVALGCFGIFPVSE